MSKAHLSFGLEYIGELLDISWKDLSNDDKERYVQFIILNLKDEHPLVREGAVIGLENIAEHDSPNISLASRIVKLMSEEDISLGVRAACKSFLETRSEYDI